MEPPAATKPQTESFGTFLYNKENGTVLGRHAKSWGEVIVYYIVYYMCLISFFAASLAIFYETISDREPRLLDDDSLLAGHPGLSYRPQVDFEESKIKVKKGFGKNTEYKESMNKFLDPFIKRVVAEGCSGAATRPGETIPCEVNYSELISHCKPEDDYGFASGNPCVLIKLNKIYGWTPDLWDKAPDFFKPEWKLAYTKLIIPVRCYAKNEKDDEHLGKVEYFPQQGFPVYYYPYENQKDYRSPMVFVKFTGAKTGTTLDIECRVYAKNIVYDRTDMQGSVQFKLHIEE